MKIGILQLSDIHFSVSADLLISRIPQLVAALRQSITGCKSCILAVTGDIADTGSLPEYQLALRFVSRLQNEIKQTVPSLELYCAAVPGNHDCDFSQPNDLRVAAIENLITNISNIDPKGRTVQELLTAQQNFFDFEKEWLGVERINWLARHHIYEIGGRRLNLACYNTAFMSQREEVQGKLCLPPRVFENSASDQSADLTVGLLHHPYAWLEANNLLFVQHQLEATCDVILTGHQHFGDSYRTMRDTARGVEYVMAPTLGDRHSSDSGFNVVVADLDANIYSVNEFVWNVEKRIYSVKQQGESRPFLRNRSPFPDIDPSFLELLRDPGFAFWNSSRKIKLQEFFVYPDLTRGSLSSSTGDPFDTQIQSDKVIDFIIKHDQILIQGGDQSGKSAFARSLFLDLTARSFGAPLLVIGDRIGSDLEKTIRNTVAEQYGSKQVDSYAQLERAKRILIIDDWHKAHRNNEWQTKLLARAAEYFGKIVVFVDDLFRLEQISERESHPFANFVRCEIREFGSVLRGMLIERFLRSGRDSTSDDSDLPYEIDEAENLVLATLGKGILPYYPGNLLLLLHAKTMQRPGGTINGSYGYLLESLITNALVTVSGSPEELDTKYTFLSRVAFHLFEKETDTVTARKVHELADEYFNLYSIKLYPEQLLAELAKAQICVISNGTVRFRYKYYYYYFVARYLDENLRSDNERQKLLGILRDMVDKVFCDDFTNVLMMFVYLTKDFEVIQYIVSRARLIYSTCTPCNLESAVEFMGNIPENQDLTLPESSVQDNRRRYREAQDELERQIETAANREKIAYSDSLPEHVKLTIAFKMLGLIGQITRSFPGSLRREIKTDLVTEGYFLGRRVLEAIFETIHDNYAEFRTFLLSAAKQRSQFKNQKSAEKEVDGFLVDFVRFCGFGVVKKMSQCLGARVLEETYRSVLEADLSITTKVIDASIKLDYIPGFPEEEVRRLWHEVSDNWYCRWLVQGLVAHHFYLFNEDYKLRQRIGMLLGLKTEAPMLIGSSKKRDKRKRRKI